MIIGSNILNIILDPIFIFYLDLGIKGAAYATVFSTLIVFIILMFYYLSGRTKVPLSLKYFKFRLYILVEIFKVALPNFLDNGLWCISASFINSILIATTGEMGPILYSVANKLKTLLIAPVRGYGRALMSVTGHLFGAHEFDELNDMFKYTLKISFITTLIIMIIFIFVRDYAFGLFSITGMEDEILAIATGGTVIMLAIPFSMISSKMLDGFGKSIYSLIFTFVKIVFEMFLIYELSILLSSGLCVLIAIMISEVLFAAIYYFFLRYMFKHFNEIYSDESTVKSFDESDEDVVDLKQETEDADESNYHKLLRRIPLIIALVSIFVLLLEIIFLPIKQQNYSMLASGAIALVIGVISVYLMERLNQPELSAFGFILNAILVFVFMGRHGYMSTILFIVTGILIMYIKIILKKLNENKDRNSLNSYLETSNE